MVTFAKQTLLMSVRHNLGVDGLRLTGDTTDVHLILWCEGKAALLIENANIAGDRDLTVAHLSLGELEERMNPYVPRLRDCVWLSGAGHWVQQERGAQCSAALLEFLAGL